MTLESATLPIEQRTRAELFLVGFKDLLSQYHEVDTNAMGFPQGWEDAPLWKNRESLGFIGILRARYALL